jgi:HEPN domain-containing protein
MKDITLHYDCVGGLFKKISKKYIDNIKDNLRLAFYNEHYVLFKYDRVEFERREEEFIESELIRMMLIASPIVVATSSPPRMLMNKR